MNLHTCVPRVELHVHLISNSTFLLFQRTIKSTLYIILDVQSCTLLCQTQTKDNFCKDKTGNQLTTWTTELALNRILICIKMPYSVEIIIEFFLLFLF